MKTKDNVKTVLLGIISGVIATIICNQLPAFRHFISTSPFQAFVVIALIGIFGVLIIIAVKLKKGQAKEGH